MSVRGGKKKRRGKKTTEIDTYTLFPTEEQYFGKVTGILGNSRVKVDVFYDEYKTNSSNNEMTSQNIPNTNINCIKEEKLGVIRGKMKRRQYVNNDDIVIVSKREFERDKVDIIHVYKNHDYRKISKHPRAPENLFSEINTDSNEFDFDYTDDNETPEKKKNKEYNMKDYIPDMFTDEEEYDSDIESS